MVDLDSDPTKLLAVVEVGKQQLITRGALTTFSLANDVSKYFAILPALFAATLPAMATLNVMHLSSPRNAVLAALIFNALVIPALIPLALRGVRFRPATATALLRRNMLTVRASETEKVLALDNGANDYVTKPFGTQELMARVRALLRTRTVSADGVLPQFDDGHLHIDLVRREVHLDGAPVALTRKEYALLSLLLRNAGRVVTQPQILAEIWGPTHQHDTHYLRILVGKLRQKLGDNAASPRWIATEPGVGLRFIG